MLQERSTQAEVVPVTPDIATTWLEKNHGNRFLRQAKVEAYARDMKSGRWVFNGAAIQFDWNGDLIDGQHRLWAVIESGQTVPFLVIRNLDPAARFTIDTGAARTAQDGLRYQHVENSKQVAPIARRLALWHRNIRVTGGKTAITHQEIYAFVRDNPQIARAAEVSLQAARTIPCSPTSVGTAYFLAAEKSRNAAEVFFVEQLIEKVGLRIDDPARVLLRKFDSVANERKFGSGVGRRINEDDALRYIILAWNAFRRGKQITKLQAPKGGWAGNTPDPL